MGAFKELDPEVIRKHLEGQEDLLSLEAKKEQVLFRHTPCPSCLGYNLEQVLNSKTPFRPGSPLPNKSLRCLQCKTEFDPYSKIIISVGQG